MTENGIVQLAEKDYVTLLIEHADQLRKLGPQPLAIACANNKFNDADEDDYWCAVQIGQSYWEQSQFFHAASRDKTTIVQDAVTAPALAEGREILRRLENRQWRQVGKDLMARNPGVDFTPWDNIYALIIEYDQAWLWIGAPVDSRGIIYACHPSGLIFVGPDEQRMDALIGAPELLLPEPFQQAVLPLLTARAQAHFRPQVADRSASHELAHYLHGVLTRLRQLTTKPVYFWLDPHQSASYPHFSFGSDKYGQKDVVPGIEPASSIAKIIDGLDRQNLRTSD